MVCLSRRLAAKNVGSESGRYSTPWVAPELLHLQGYDIRHKEARPSQIEFHFRRVVHRLVSSLRRLHQESREYDRFIENGALRSQNPILAFEIPEEAGIAADSVFHYLTLFIDDLARIMPFILAEDDHRPEEPSGFGELKSKIAEGSLRTTESLKKLFVELDSNDSWWTTGFKRGVGMRQRLTHYTDLVYFSASSKVSDSRMTSDISLITVGSPVRVVDFESALQNLLRRLFEWLDHLEVELLACLAKRLANHRIDWSPFDEQTPAVRLPLRDDARPDALHYLYLPVCS